MHLSLVRTLRSATLLLFSLSGCSLFFGNVKVDEKSDRYSIQDLPRAHPDWQRLERSSAANAEAKSEASGDTIFSDLAFQSKQTGSIISFNSSCRTSSELAPAELKDLQAQTRLLLLGLAGTKDRNEKEITVAEQKALETTVEGKIAGSRTRLRTVVLRKGKCQYDLMFIARPEHFAGHEATFAQFVASLRLQ